MDIKLPPATRAATGHLERIHGTQRETGDRIRCCGISPQLIIRFPVSPCLQVYPAANRQYLAKVRIAYPYPYPYPNP